MTLVMFGGRLAAPVTQTPDSANRACWLNSTRIRTGFFAESAGRLLGAADSLDCVEVGSRGHVRRVGRLPGATHLVRAGHARESLVRLRAAQQLERLLDPKRVGARPGGIVFHLPDAVQPARFSPSAGSGGFLA